MTNIHVEHLVLRVGPHYRNIAVRQQALDSQWVVCRVKRYQHMDMTIETRTGFPTIPLIRGREKCFRQIAGYGAGPVVKDQLRRQRRPAVVVKDASADERHKPWPLGGLVVVC